MITEHFKSQFIRQLKIKIGSHKNWNDELANLLHVSPQSIYRKVKKEGFFSLDEVLILADYYKISIDQLLEQSPDQIRFNCPNLLSPINSIEDYLNRLVLSFGKVSTMKNPKIFYATRELPIFYYFLNDTFTSFKLYVFARTIWSIPRFNSAKFDMNLFDPNCFKITKLLWNNYAKLNSEEFWNSNIIDNTIHQILYYYECGDINKDDAFKVIDSIIEVIRLCKNMALRGSKSEVLEDNLVLYNNRILHTGNHVLVRSDHQDMLFLTYDSPNFLTTDNQYFIKYSINWYKQISENSYTLGKGSGHNNANFFKSLIESAEVVYSKIT